jgi:biopolymer transport protein TolQ
MGNVIQFVSETGVVGKIVLIILFIFSVISWTVIFEKLRLIKKIRKEQFKFQRLFKIRTKPPDRLTFSKEFKYSPIARTFLKNFDILTNLKSNTIPNEPSNYRDVNNISAQHQSSIKELIEASVSNEMGTYENRLIVLATTVSVSPFLGLFGTVWGIMTAFLNIGLKGSADISAVGPGIAEALITTAGGLAVAIPALVAHNFIVDRFRQIENDTKNFFTDLLIREKLL